jgi:CheY-like chemotaxis protein
VNPSIEVTEAADASEAIAAMRAGAFDVALLDRHFPGGGHAAVLEAMTGLQPHLVPGTILMSGALEEDANERIGLGYGAALNKPFDLRALTQTITRLAQRG